MAALRTGGARRMLASATRVYRFGIFELNAGTRQLNRNGREARIQDQPCRVLQALLDRHGELVTREDLREKIWPTETFVEFDDGLNTAVQKIRQALGDDARNPRFIETIPRRGYRFIAPVQVDEGPVVSRIVEDPSPVVATRTQRSDTRRWSGMAVFAAAGLAAGLLLNRPASSPQPPAMKLTITPPAPIELQPGFRGGSAISPDGKAVVFTASRNGGTQLWLRNLDSLEAKELRGTEGALLPFWSPDSTAVGFVSGRKLRTVDLAGGPAQDLAEVSRPTRGAWFSDGTIIYSPGRGEPLRRVRRSGGEAVAATDPASGGAYWPAAIPGTNRFVYFSDSQGTVNLGSLGDPKQNRQLFHADSNAVYSQSPDGRLGYLVWMRGTVLVAQSFDVKAERLIGDPQPIADHVGFADHARFVDLSSSLTGTLLYGAGNMIPRRAGWVRRDGSFSEAVSDSGWLRGVRLSPDGQRTIIDRGIDRALWMTNLGLGVTTRLTLEHEPSGWPAWSPDGSEVAYSGQRGGRRLALYHRDSRGGSPEQLLAKSEFDLYLYDWSRDGRYVAYCEMNPRTKIDVWILPMGPQSKPYALFNTAFNEDSPQFSPDTSLIAYVSDETGRNEVYVAGFPDTTTKWQISTQGGSMPRWSRNGQELFYVSADNHLISVPAGRSARQLQWSAQRRLFPMPAPSASYDIAPSGDRFLVLKPTEDFRPNELTVLMNWQSRMAR